MVLVTKTVCSPKNWKTLMCVPFWRHTLQIKLTSSLQAIKFVMLITPVTQLGVEVQ